MSRIVVDASVAVKWFVPEVHSDRAKRLLQGDFELLAPDLILAEVGNVLWKKTRRGEISVETGGNILRDFKRFPIRVYDSAELAELAWDLAIHFDRTFYDSLYLALARSLDCSLATADRRFYNSLQETLLVNSMLWVEDL